MIYDIVISDQAEIDLRGIFEYIAFELQAPENANGQLDRLEACIMDLDHMSKRYRQYELEPWKSRGLRVAPVDNYLVLYIPDDDTQVVTIIRVMYGGRDVNTQLNRFTKTNNLKASIRNGWCFFHAWRNLGFLAHFYGRRYQSWLTELWVLLSRSAEIPPNYKQPLKV